MFDLIFTNPLPFLPSRRLSVVLFVMCFSALGYGQIMSYTTSTSGALNSVAINCTGTALTRVNGVTTTTTPCSTGFSSTNFSSSAAYSNALSATEVTVTPSAGYALNVTGFQADLRRSASGPASVRFAYSLDGGATWVDQGIDHANPSASCAAGNTLSWATTFSVNAPSTLKFRIYGFNASSTVGTEQILNLSINGTVVATTSACPIPNTLSASNITNTTAKLNWNVVLGSTTYNVRYRKVGTTTWSTTSSVTNSLSVSGLTAATTYEYQVQTVCAAGASNYTASTNFTTGTACPVPSNLTITNINTTSATLNWGAVAGAASYNVRYRKSGTTTWTTATSATNALTITGLIISTSYNFQVQTVCTGSTLSSFSTSGTFTTGNSSTCSVPSGFSTVNITSISATVNWSAVAGAMRYNIQYRKAGTTVWTADTTATNTYSISGLSPSTAYEFQAQTVCAGGVTSAFSASTTFTTLGPCGSVATGFSVSNITMTTATLNWYAVAGAVSYNIHYRPTGTTTWTSTTSATNSKAISGLTAGNTYEFQVQIVCAVGVTSSYSASSVFSTSAILPRPDHVVVVIMENHSYSNIVGSSAAPYINALLVDTNAVAFTKSYAVTHPSQPNYINLFSGSNQGVTSDSVPTNYPFATPNLARELIDSGLTFTTYSEGLPSVGYDGATSGYYARKHNPAANWVGTGTNQIANTTNQPFTSFPTTNYASLPTVCYVVPNLVNDMHNGTGNPPITAGDNWYHTYIAPYVQWAETHNSLLILTWDEDDNSSSNQILTIFAGQMVKAPTDTMHINHYNVLRTIEDMYKLPHAGNAASVLPITNCWKTVHSNAPVCDWSLWSHVYHSYRLAIHDTCTYVTGTIDHLIYEADGDIHIRMHLDTIWSPMLNSMNISSQYGDMVLEPICATSVTQADAVSACAGFVNTVYIPNVGEHVKVTGSYVTDNDHGWNEIHPVTSIVISTQTQRLASVSDMQDDGVDDDYIAVKTSPNPTNNYVDFELGKRANEVVYIEIMDGLGRSAGQYQLLATDKLHITTSYLPAGMYYYNVKQNNRVMNSGKFVVMH